MKSAVVIALDPLDLLRRKVAAAQHLYRSCGIRSRHELRARLHAAARRMVGQS